MMLIRCPACGPRAEWEYTFGGPAHVARPGPPSAVDDDAWGEYLFARDNPKGPHRERWCHAYGCGTWFNVERHTVTHRIASVYAMGSPPPEAA